MRVLVCIPCLLTGGTEVQTLALVEALAGAGHRVGVVCYFGWEEGMAARFREAGAELFLLSQANAPRPRGLREQWSFLWRGLRQTVREFRPDAAHVQYMTPGALPVVILRLLGVRRVLATAHTAADIYSPRGLKLVRALSRTMLTAFQCITQRAERGFFGNSRMLEEIRGIKGRGSHFTIHNALPSSFPIALGVHPARLERVNEGRPVFGVVSRLEEIKGIDLVVPAFAGVRKRIPGARLVVVGDGALLPIMREQTEAFGLGGRTGRASLHCGRGVSDQMDCVEFAGRRDAGELPDLYDRIDVLLMPSRSEGFGLTAIEGMARGCVPVVADTGGLPEVVTSGAGLLHKREDTASMAEAMLSALSDFETLSAGALRRAQDFTPARYRARIHRLYEMLSQNA